ncbi:hypothetical protein CYMTET_38860 [Cymbomonas tetramitiformis]|uniref:Uncharacterized protein n=1 Tax=Cymbomonas tetramitiformis TaxID=36881 RepID=A0AAE0CB70_9CHLO|nr:hypothetical protein CYMTET_38860 [Cymbomonas tetramitiformis]
MLFDPYMDSAQVVKRQLLTLGLRLYSDAPLASGIMTLQTAFMPQASTIRRPCMTDSSPFPVSTSFYPARYDRLGFSDAPKHQGDMAQVFKPVLNGTAHADDGRSECTGIFVDDGHRVYDRDLGKAESARRALAEIDQLAELGVQASYPQDIHAGIGRGVCGPGDPLRQPDSDLVRGPGWKVQRCSVQAASEVSTGRSSAEA